MEIGIRPVASIVRAAGLCAVMALAGCTGIPQGVTPVTGFELERYLGTWYEIARLDHPFERGLSRVTATYSRRDDGGVAVVNRGYDAEEGEWQEAAGRAYFIDEPDVGRLKVSFFGPFYGAYNIIALDADYRHAMVAGPNRDYLWLLSRNPTLPATDREALVDRARALGFPVDELIFVEQAAIRLTGPCTGTGALMAAAAAIARSPENRWSGRNGATTTRRH